MGLLSPTTGPNNPLRNYAMLFVLGTYVFESAVTVD